MASSEYDMETARHLLATGRYLYVVFLCHLALEKMLKALAGEALGRMAPRTHDLIFLTRTAGVAVPQEHMDFIGRINAASIPTRYPEDLDRAVAAYPRAVAEEYLTKTGEVVAWLRSDPRLQGS
ncbi:MAG: HEPN domain-containing protein [Candidatus Omnitrophica bacterium]|nr:HEPN domain-containing protein [Candidatus Omnitrophota bacterium]